MEVEDLKRKPDMEAEQTLTMLGGLEATPMYMSPEQVAESVDIDHRTDIYSLGAVLYEVLTLESMAWGDTMSEMLTRTQFDKPPTPSERSPHRDIPKALEEVCMACVAKDPADRIQDAAQLIQRLQAARVKP
jgi:serine/threonine protein kinase